MYMMSAKIFSYGMKKVCTWALRLQNMLPLVPELVIFIKKQRTPKPAFVLPATVSFLWPDLSNICSMENCSKDKSKKNVSTIGEISFLEPCKKSQTQRSPKLLNLYESLKHAKVMDTSLENSSSNFRWSRSAILDGYSEIERESSMIQLKQS